MTLTTFEHPAYLLDAGLPEIFRDRHMSAYGLVAVPCYIDDLDVVHARIEVGSVHLDMVVVDDRIARGVLQGARAISVISGIIVDARNRDDRIVIDEKKAGSITIVVFSVGSLIKLPATISLEESLHYGDKTLQLFLIFGIVTKTEVVFDLF
jgi:hypothetical protein